MTTCPRWLERPLRGGWTLATYPDDIVVDVEGQPRSFRRTMLALDRPNAVAQYREVRRRRSLHMVVFRDGTWVIDHEDCVNPDYGPSAAAAHLDADVGFRGLATLALSLTVAAGVGLAIGALAKTFSSK